MKFSLSCPTHESSSQSSSKLKTQWYIVPIPSYIKHKHNTLFVLIFVFDLLHLPYPPQMQEKYPSSQILSMNMEEKQEQKLIKHSSIEKQHDKAMHMHMHTPNPNPNPSQTIMRLASLAISFNVRLKSSDMPVHMQEHALHHTRSLFPLLHPSPKPSNTHIARALKKEFDLKYGLAWHCVIGKSFGSFVSHTSGGFIYFSIDSLSVLLFKTEVHLVTQPPPP